MKQVQGTRIRRPARTAAGSIIVLLTIACGGGPGSGLAPAPFPLEEFCLEAQQVVVRTRHPGFSLVNHEDFDEFVLSKAIIEPLTIQQYIWTADGAPQEPVMISCKLKSADHLNEAFGPGTAGPPGACQDMNRLTAERVRARLGARAAPVVFDEDESVDSGDNPGMGGPAWLAPFQLTWRDQAGTLHVRTKGFRVDWLDPQFAAAPARFRGVQYCHFIAPDYLAGLLTGTIEPGVTMGRDVSDFQRRSADPPP